MDLTHEQKLSLLQQLIQVASADGEHRDEEYDMLHHVAEALQVEPMDMERLFTESVPYHPPKHEIKRITAFVHLLRMVWSDNELDYDEVTLLKDLGMKLGLQMQAVNQVIERSKLFAYGAIPNEEVVKIFQVHHN